MGSSILSARILKKRGLRAGVSLAALALPVALASPASAREYLVGNETALAAAITAANADGDASATIVLTASFTVTASLLPTPARPMTIDTRGFTLSGLSGAAIAALTLDNTGGNPITLEGSFTGGDGAGATAGGIAVYTRSTVNRSSVINNATLTGGTGGAGGGAGGIGARMVSTTFVNNATIRGGTGGGAGAGGAGADITRNSVLTNYGLIEGGQGATGGSGVVFNGPINASTLVNYGTIRGGAGTAGSISSSGALVRFADTHIVNNGLIEGGTGGAGIAASNGTLNLDIVNSGTIRAGAGQTDAIGRAAAATTGTLTLELRPGSVIEGNVVAGATPTTDVLRLGGTGSDSFDISAIGAAQQYRDFDIFEKTGSSTWLLTGVATATTDWTIYDGTLLVGDHSAASSVIGNITNFATLGGSGTIFGDVSNSGTVAPGNSIGTLTVSGNYTGNGGTLLIESELGGDASPSDRLVVTGNTAGTTGIKVVNLGGGGAQTVEGIKIVDVGGTSAGQFSLLGDYVFQGDQAVVGGAYAYRLYKNGLATPADGDWYLRSDLAFPGATGPLYQAGVPLYETYPQLLLALNGLSTLQQRVGDRYRLDDADAPGKDGPDNVWLRSEGVHAGIKPEESTSGTDYDYDLFRLEAGLDGELYQDGNGRLIGGLTLRYGTVSGNVGSLYGDGRIDSTGYGIGATLTWHGEDGTYLDAQGQITSYDSDLSSDLVDGALESGNNGFGYALSLEAGRRFAAAGPWSLTPQAQLVYSSVRFGDFDDRFGAPVSLSDGDSLLGRLGAALEREDKVERADGRKARVKVYGIANLYGEFLDGTAVDVAGTGFETRNDPLWAGLTLGGSYSWEDERYSLYGEVAARSSLKTFADSYALAATAGFRMKW